VDEVACRVVGRKSSWSQRHRPRLSIEREANACAIVDVNGIAEQHVPFEISRQDRDACGPM
jgi:hypothetical protein